MDDALASNVLEALPAGIVIHDPGTGEIYDVNETYPAMHGYERDDLIGNTIDIVSADTPEYSLKEATHRIQHAREEGSVQFEWRNKRADDTVFPVEVELSPISVDDDEYVVATVREISDRKEHERKLTEVTTRLELALEGTSTGVWEWDLDTDEVIWDEQMEQLFEYDEGEFDGSYEGFLDRIHPEDIDEVEAAHERGIEEGFYQAEFRVSVDGETERWVRARAQVLYEDGDPAEMIGVAMDITERKKRERALERAQEQLQEQRDNLQLLNEVMRHDIRNDLTVIEGYAELLTAHVDDEAERELETVQQKTKEVIELTKTARDLAEVMLQSDAETKEMSLVQPLESEIEAARTGHSEAVVTLEEPLPESPIEADEMLDAVFRNLLQNAIQHNDKDIPKVVVTAEESADSVQVRIADNGPGVPDPQKEEIFAKGETGLESSGAGLGLYFVETLVDRYGGDVWVEDNDPGGAVFVVELPKAR